MLFKRTTVISLVIVCLIAIVFYSFLLRVRCSPWKSIQEDAPLCEVGKTAISKSRVCYPPIFVPAVEWTEYAWDTGNHLLHRNSIVKEIDDHLKKIKFIKKQKPLESYVNDIQQHIAPYRFFIVSLEPTIVVMIDYDYGNIERKSRVELCGNLNEQYIDYSKYLVNAYHYGSSVSKSSNYKWFSPKYTKEIQEVVSDGQVFTIQTKTAKLIFGDKEKDGWYSITRQ